MTIKTQNFARALLASGALLLSTACGGPDVVVEGRVTDGDGPSAQSFGGEGTARLATQVKAYRADAPNALAAVATAELDGSGTYAMSLPASDGPFIFKAVDADGDVMAAALFEGTGELDGVRYCKPMTSESSLEARVVETLHAEGYDTSELDLIDVQERVTAEMATDIRARAVEDPDDPAIEAQLKSIADAVYAAQRAEVESYGESEVTTNPRAQQNATLEARLELNAALHQGTETPADALATYRARADEARASMGIDLSAHARATLASAAAFRAVFTERAPEEPELQEGGLSAAATTEANVITKLNLEKIQDDGSDATVDAVESANAELRSAVALAESRASLAAAFDAYADAMIDGQDETILDVFLGVDLSNELVLDDAILAISDAAVNLDADLEAAASSLGEDKADLDRWAEQCVNAYAVYDAVVEGQAQILEGAFGPRGRIAAEVIAVTRGGFAGSF